MAWTAYFVLICFTYSLLFGNHDHAGLPGGVQQGQAEAQVPDANTDTNDTFYFDPHCCDDVDCINRINDGYGDRADCRHRDEHGRCPNDDRHAEPDNVTRDILNNPVYKENCPQEVPRVLARRPQLVQRRNNPLQSTRLLPHGEARRREQPVHVRGTGGVDQHQRRAGLETGSIRNSSSRVNNFIQWLRDTCFLTEHRQLSVSTARGLSLLRRDQVDLERVVQNHQRSHFDMRQDVRERLRALEARIPPTQRDSSADRDENVERRRTQRLWERVHPRQRNPQSQRPRRYRRDRDAPPPYSEQQNSNIPTESIPEQQPPRPGIPNDSHNIKFLDSLDLYFPRGDGNAARRVRQRIVDRIWRYIYHSTRSNDTYQTAFNNIVTTALEESNDELTNADYAPPEPVLDGGHDSDVRNDPFLIRFSATGYSSPQDAARARDAVESAFEAGIAQGSQRGYQKTEKDDKGGELGNRTTTNDGRSSSLRGYEGGTNGILTSADAESVSTGSDTIPASGLERGDHERRGSGGSESGGETIPRERTRPTPSSGAIPKRAAGNGNKAQSASERESDAEHSERLEGLQAEVPDEVVPDSSSGTSPTTPKPKSVCRPIPRNQTDPIGQEPPRVHLVVEPGHPFEGSKEFADYDDDDWHDEGYEEILARTREFDRRRKRDRDRKQRRRKDKD